MIALLLMIAGCQPSSRPSGGTVLTAPAAGDVAPYFELQSLEGERVSLSTFKGKPVMLNFWATWCPPCRAEMPYLQQIYDEWKGRGLALLTIDVGESPSRVRSYLQSNNLSLPVLLDIRGSVRDKYGVRAYPTTFFIDEDGIIRGMQVGAFRSKAEIEQYLRKIVP